MSNKTVIASVIVLALLLAGFLWLSPFGDTPKETNEAPIGNGETNTEAGELRVDHFYADGVHTLEGTLTTPTPCHEIKSDVITETGDPVRVIVNLRTESVGEICTQVVTDKLWSVRFEAPENARIEGTLNGVPIRFVSGDVEGAAIDKL